MAETRTVRTVLEMNASRFIAGATAASGAARSLATGMASVGTAQSKLKGDYDRVANTLLGVGTAAVTGLGLATKAAMDWETAWAGVTKTVDGNAAQMAELEGQLRSLATSLPASHEEIAAVAEAAGQLGVKREDVASFTKTMIDLGETTNLSADEAATAIAQFSNVMHVSARDTDNLGAALVDLGNKGASTEKDILMMAQRLSGTGALIGASSQDILGLSSALADVGISAEAGGGSISRVLQKMNTSVLDGGKNLEAFAKVAGVSAEEFAQKWRSSPVEAFQLFEKGLQGVTDSGGNAVSTLRDLGIRSSEETRAVLSLASNYQGLGTSIDTANTAWQQNTALVAEATKRYETSESKLKIAGNTLHDAAIDIGGALVPMLATAAESISGVVKVFQGLPQPVKSALAYIGLVGGAGAVAAGGLMKLVPAATETIGAFRRIREASNGLPPSFGKVAKAAGAVAAAFTIMQAAGSVAEMFDEEVQSADTMAVKLMNLANTSGVTASALDQLATVSGTGGASIEGFGDSMRAVNANGFLKTLDSASSLFGVFDSDAKLGAESIRNLDQAMSGMADSGSMTELATSFKAATESAKEYGFTASDVLDQMPMLKNALTTQATALGLQADNATLVKIAMGEYGNATGAAASAQGEFKGAIDGGTQSAEEQKKALEALEKQVQDASNTWLGARGSARDYEAAIDEATAAVEKNGATLNRHTEKGRENEAALDNIASTAHEYAAAQLELTGSSAEANKVLGDARDKFIATAQAMGKSKGAAEAAADSAGLVKDAYDQLPSEVSTTIDVDTAGAETAMAALQFGLDAITASNPTAKVDADVTPANTKVLALTQQIDSSTGAVTVTGDTAEAMTQVQNFRTTVNGMGGTVTINGSTVHADDALNMLIDAVDHSNGTVTINGQSVPADQALATMIAQINKGKGTVTISGNNGPAKKKTDEAVADANKAHGTIDVTAATGLANAAIDRAARDRTARINVVATGAIGFAKAVLGRAGGGWLSVPKTTRGLSDGGWVPGAYPGPGVDNVLWPTRAGAAAGRFLNQPLAGNEYVVNGKRARQFAPLLEAINWGTRSPSTSVSESRAAVPSVLVIQDADGTFLGRMRTVGTDAAISVVNQR